MSGGNAVDVDVRCPRSFGRSQQHLVSLLTASKPLTRTRRRWPQSRHGAMHRIGMRCPKSNETGRDRTSRRRGILSADDVPHRHHGRGAEIAVVQPRCAGRLSGTVGIDVSTGQMAASSIQEQTRHALRNCTAILQAGGATLDDVVHRRPPSHRPPELRSRRP